MDKSDFVIAEIKTAKLNALVKMLMKQTGSDWPEGAIDCFLYGKWVARPAAEVSSGELPTLSASVDRSLPLQRMFGEDFSEADIAEMNIPLGKGDQVTMSFFCAGSYVKADMLGEVLRRFGLELIVDPVGLAAIYQAHPEFAGNHRGFTQWKNDAGKVWCLLCSERGSYVHRRGNMRDCDWWYPVRPIAKV